MTLVVAKPATLNQLQSDLELDYSSSSNAGLW